MSIGAVPLALTTVATALNLGSAYGQANVANQSRALQEKQLREEQVQLRLQQNQASIERMKKLRSVLATTEVMAGQRGISPESSSLRAGYEFDIENFHQDETADALNYGAKNVKLQMEREQARQLRNAQLQGAMFGFAKDSLSLGMSAFGYGGRSGYGRSSIGAPRIASQNLVDASGYDGGESPFDLNTNY